MPLIEPTGRTSMPENMTKKVMHTEFRRCVGGAVDHRSTTIET